MANQTITENLKQVFGFDRFRAGQQEIVETILDGHDVLAIMPTGGGKSLCFQLPALSSDGVTLVISPLIALMRDQVRALREVGVPAGCLTSGNTEEETENVLRDLRSGALKVLYIAPERLASSWSVDLLRASNVSLIAVDEAHCVSQWGHDFRPDYLRIGRLREILNVPLAAFTATADEETRQEICDKLFAERPKVFLRGFDRPNIHLKFLPKATPRKQIIEFAEARRGQSGIVYCGTRAKTQTIAKALNDQGLRAVFYHGGMEAEDRRSVETQFQQEDGLIVAATIAFGMGIDKPDIRWVAHADLPKSIESYYQEIGRAGRDGAPAETLTLFGADDIRFRRAQIDEGLAPPERRDADHGRLNTLLGLAESLSCRRQTLLGYFGETSDPCGNCDTCQQAPKSFDATTSVQKALSAVLRTGQTFGAGYLVDLLTGTATDRIQRNGHDGLVTFGCGAEHKRGEWENIFRQMMAHDLLRPDPERRGGLFMTTTGREYLSGDIPVRFRVAEKIGKATAPAKSLVSEEDEGLLSALKAKRRELAEAAKVPAYVIFTDRTLIEIAQNRPQTLDDMARISGIGAKKLEKYGAVFLSVSAAQEPASLHPARRKLAGKEAGSLYDRLQDVQSELANGACGTQKPMRCSSSELARVAKARPSSIAALERVLAAKYIERFGAAFLDAIAAQD